MATDLKRVNLMLDEPILRELKARARREELSVSALVRRILARDLGLERDVSSVVESIRKLRAAAGPMPDSTALIRESRDRGW